MAAGPKSPAAAVMRYGRRAERQAHTGDGAREPPVVGGRVQAREVRQDRPRNPREDEDRHADEHRGGEDHRGGPRGIATSAGNYQQRGSVDEQLVGARDHRQRAPRTSAPLADESAPPEHRCAARRSASASAREARSRPRCRQLRAPLRPLPWKRPRATAGPGASGRCRRRGGSRSRRGTGASPPRTPRPTYCTP